MSEAHQDHQEAFDESEISFGDIIDYITGSWRWLLAGAVVGPMVAFLFVSFTAKYKAEIVLDNLTITSKDTKDTKDTKDINVGLSFMEWRILSETLPLLAGQVVENQRDQGEEAKEAWLASPGWWVKNVTPTYGLSKSDTKNLAEIGDALKGESTKITNLKVSYQDRSKEKALERADETVSYLRKGALYLRLKNQLEGYKSEVILTEQKLKKELLDNDIELRYRHEREKTLENLIAAESKGKTDGKIIVDVRNGEAKYLPLDTQLNAVKIDINELEEAQQRLQDQGVMNGVIGDFVKEASPIINAEKKADGITLSQTFLDIESRLKSQMGESDWVKLSAVGRLHSDLVTIQSRFSTQMPEISRVVNKTLPVLPALAGGFIGGLFFALFGTLFNRRYRQYLDAKASAAA